MKNARLQNRKYLGSKRELAETICDYIKKTSGVPEVFFDVFLGTGAVSAEFIESGTKKIIGIDNLLFNTIIFSGFAALPEKTKKKADEIVSFLNTLKGQPGYLSKHFGNTYFSYENCMLMDRIRDKIEEKYISGNIEKEIYYYLMASFLIQTDRVANTLGQYDAYLKNLGAGEYKNGKHVSDRRVYEPFALVPLSLLPECDMEIITDDVMRIADCFTADTAYIDPPYNNRQYSTNYHLLENIARWEKKPVFGKTKKINLDNLKSLFSSKRHARDALKKLLSMIRAAHIYLSYSSEGIITLSEIEDILSDYSSVKKWEIPYPVFGRGAGVSQKRTVTEYLFYCKKT